MKLYLKRWGPGEAAVMLKDEAGVASVYHDTLDDKIGIFLWGYYVDRHGKYTEDLPPGTQDDIPF